MNLFNRLPKKDKINIIPVEYIDEVLEIAFTLDSTYEKKVEDQPVSVKKKSKKTADTASDSVADTVSV